MPRIFLNCAELGSFRSYTTALFADANCSSEGANVDFSVRAGAHATKIKSIVTAIIFFMSEGILSVCLAEGYRIFPILQLGGVIASGHSKERCAKFAEESRPPHRVAPPSAPRTTSGDQGRRSLPAPHGLGLQSRALAGHLEQQPVDMRLRRRCSLERRLALAQGLRASGCPV